MKHYSVPRFKPLNHDQIEWLKKYIKDHKLSRAHLAEKYLCINRSTFDDMMHGKNARRKNREKVEAFIKSQNKTEVQEIKSKIPDSTVSGNEKPEKSERELNRLARCFQLGADILLPLLTELANGDPGTRIEFHKKFGEDLQELYTLSRALQSESMRQRVLEESRKTRLP